MLIVIDDVSCIFRQSAICCDIHHAGTIVSQEHLVGSYVGTNLQVGCIVGANGLQRSTVATHKDRTADDGRFRLCACHTDRDLLGIGTEVIEGSNRCLTLWNVIVEVAPDDVIF